LKSERTKSWIPKESLKSAVHKFVYLPSFKFPVQLFDLSLCQKKLGHLATFSNANRGAANAASHKRLLRTTDPNKRQARRHSSRGYATLQN